MIGTKSRDDRVFEFILTAVLIIILIITVYPLYFVVIASFSDPLLVNSGQVFLLPKGIQFNAYKMVFRDPDILTGYKNTIFYTVFGTFINIILTTMAAYPISRPNFVGRLGITWFFVFTMIFSGGLVPTYLLVSQLGLRNTVWAMLLPGAISVCNLIIMRTFFQSGIPNELCDAAQIDGCSNTGVLLHVVLPLSKPIIAVMVLFYGVGHWNDFFSALIYITKSQLYPLQLVLRTILVQNSISDQMMSDVESIAAREMLVESIKYALIIVSTLPIMMLYPFLQKYFVKGVMIGAIKG